MLSVRGSSWRTGRVERLLILGAIVASVVLSTPGFARAAVGSLSFQQCLATSRSGGCTAASGLGGLHGVVVSPTGADVYVVGKPANSGQITELKRSPTGTLSEIGCISQAGVGGCTSGHGLIGAAGIAITADGKSVYAASDTSNSVTTFTRNVTTGLLTETGCISESASTGCTAAKGLDAATGIAVSPNGANVYATSESSNAVVVFTRNVTTGLLTWRNCLAESGAEGCTDVRGLTQAENPTVSPNGANVYVTGFLGNSVVDFTRNASTGYLTFASCIAESGADGCVAGHGLKGADGVVVSPSDTSLYVAAESSSAVVTFTRAGNGALVDHSCAAEAAGDTCTRVPGLGGAARVAISADGTSVYVAGYRGNTLDTFARSTAGLLTAQSPCFGASGNSDGCTVESGLTAPAGLAVSPDGKNVYTGAASSNAVDSFVRQTTAP